MLTIILLGAGFYFGLRQFKINQAKAKDFSWGVLAINTNKSIFKPGEQVKFDMAVLDETGLPVCDADLKLKITHLNEQGEVREEKLSTEGKTIIVNPECEIHNRTTKPDYEASLPAEGVGRYQLRLDAKTKNGIKSVESYFDVQENSPFDIERNLSTRIYPPKPYPVDLKITANQDFQGLIKEKIPSALVISPSLDYPPYDALEEKDGQKILSWQVNLKKGDQIHLGYRFDLPEKSPDFFELGPLTIGNFQESRAWQLASDAIVSNIIVMWPGSTSLPTGWSRKTELDGYFIESGIGTGSTNPESNTALGSATHSHTSPNHSHTIGHTHLMPTQAAEDVAPHSGTSTGAAADTHVHGTQMNSGTSSVTNNDATGVKNSLGSVGVWNTAPSNPPYTSVIFIKSNGTNNIPNGAWAFYYSAAPTGWNRVNANQYVKGATAGGAGGGTGGAVGHSHTDSGHTHTEAAHIHTGSSSDQTNSKEATGGVGTTYAPASHTHTLTADSQVATEVGGVGLGATNNGEPLFIKVNTIQNDTGSESLPDNVIAIWTGTTASIPSPWYLCDGTNSTPNLNIGRFIKGANTDVDIGTTGGASTHTHASGGTHTHTINNHTHTWTVGGNSGTGVGAATSNRDTNVQGHTHAAATNATSGGNSGPADTTADANTDNRPLYKNVYLIQYHAPKINISGITDVTSGNVAIAFNGNIQTGTTAPISSGTWQFTSISQPSSNDIVTTWVTGATNANKTTGVTEYDGSGNIDGMVLNKHVLSVGSTGDSATVTVTNLGLYDYAKTTDIIHQVSGTTLTIDPGGIAADEKIDVLAGNTLTIDNTETLATYDLTITGILTSVGNATYNVAHNWTNNGTFNADTSTVTLNGTTAQTINGSSATAFKNLTISNTVAAIAVSTNFSVASGGNLTVNASAILNPAAGVVISGSGTLTGFGKVNVTRTDTTADFASQYTISGKTLTNLTVDYTAAGQTLTNTIYGHLTISGSIITGNSATIGGVFTVSGTFAPSVGSIITMDHGSSIVNSGNLTFQGLTIAASATVSTSASFSLAATLTVNTSANFSPSGGTITMTGNSWGITKIGTLVFKGLTIDGTPSPQPTNDFSVNGALTVNSGKTLAPTDGTITMTGGSIVNSGGATTNLVFNNLTVTGSPSTSSDFTVNRTLNVSGGNLTPSDGTITMATTSWAITNSGALVFKGLIISETPSSSGQPTSSFSVNGALTVNNGKTLAPTDGTITMTGGSIVNNGGATTNLVFNNLTVSGTATTASNFTINKTLNVSGSFSASTGTITMATTGWGITNSGTLAFSGLTIAETPSVSGQPSSSFSVAGALIVSSGKNLSPGGGTITMTGTGWGITNSGTLVFSGLKISGTPSSQPTADFSVSGTLTVDSTKELSPGASSTITMTGGSIANSGTLNFYNLIVSGSTSTTSTFAIVNDLTVNGTLTVSSGTGIITANGNITGSGTMTLTAGTFQQVVATDKTFGSSSNANAWTFNNLKFNNSSASNARKITPNAGTGDIIIGASGTLTLGDSGTQTITFDNEAANDRFFDINGNFTISTQGIFLASSSKDFKIAGSYSNSGTFTANSGAVTFDATSGSKTIDAGNSTFYDVVFNSSSGGWTIQINNLTTTRNLTITDVSSLAIAASKTVEVDGTYSVADAEADDITWNSNSVLYLKSGTPYTVGTKNQAAATYAILQIGASTDIRLWNSTASTFWVNASGSLYSQDHANANGDLYIWGDYHTQTAENPDHDYWSYAKDFDGTNLTSGSERGVDVRIDPSSNVTADSGDTLAAIGAISPNRTTVSRQGGSGGYGITVASGSTINFQYTDFDYLDGNKGLDIQTSANVTSLNYTAFNNLVGGVATDDAFITVASTVIGIGTSAVFTGVQINNNGAGAEFNINRTGDTLTGYWDFDASTGDYDGEAFDGDDGVNEADPGMLRWDDSNVAPSSPTSLLTEGETNPTNVADNTPEFSAIYNDLNIGDTANAYQIQVADNQGFTGPIWDSGQQSMTNCGKDNRCQDISYAGSTPSEGITYYWRIKFWDIGGLGGTWSTEEAYFQLVWTANQFRFRDIRLRDLRVKPIN